MKGTNGNSGKKGSHETLVPYTRPRKPAVSAEERARNRKSLIVYKIERDENE